MIERPYARLSQRTKRPGSPVPGRIAMGEAVLSNGLTVPMAVDEDHNAFLAIKTDPGSIPQRVDVIREHWLQVACDDGWVEEYRIDYQHGAIVIAAVAVHPGRPTLDIDTWDAEKEWEGYGTVLPGGGLTQERLAKVSTRWALDYYKRLCDEYLTQEVQVGSAIQIAAFLAFNRYGVAFEAAVVAEQYFTSNCGGESVRVDKAREVFGLLCEHWGIPEDELDEAMGVFERACRRIDIEAVDQPDPWSTIPAHAERREGAWLLDKVMPTRLEPHRTSGPAAKMTALEASRFARAYVEECKINARNPKVTLAQRLGLSVDEAEQRRAFIVDKSLFVGNGQGRPGGTLTAKAEEILRRDNEQPT